MQPIKTMSGTVRLPGSKSLSNRILLLAALSEGTTLVKNLLVIIEPHHARLHTWRGPYAQPHWAQHPHPQGEIGRAHV